MIGPPAKPGKTWQNPPAMVSYGKGASPLTIHLSKDLEQIVNDAVRSGLYTGENDVIRDALTRLKQSLPQAAPLPAQKAKRSQSAKPKQKPLTRAEFDQHLLAIGLLSQLPDTEADFDDPDDEPIEIKGEPLSETIIRERR
jgi:Arc/MetJ-type ribon-helix-helix transcriptional regulator